MCVDPLLHFQYPCAIDGISESVKRQGRLLNTTIVSHRPRMFIELALSRNHHINHRRNLFQVIRTHPPHICIGEWATTCPAVQWRVSFPFVDDLLLCFGWNAQFNYNGLLLPHHRAPVQPEVRREGPGEERQEVREGGEDREGEGQEGDPEGQHGRGQDPRRERDPAKVAVPQLPPDECPSGRRVQSSAVRTDHASRDHLDGWRGQGDGRRDEGHEPGADLWPDGQVRAAVRGPGRAELGDGEHNVADGDHGHSAERSGHALARGGR